MDLKNRYIKVTRDNEMEVLKVLEELGFVWIDNSKPTNFKPLEVNIIPDSLLIRLGRCNILSYFINMSCNKYFIEDTEITLEELKSFLPNNIPKVIRKLTDVYKDMRDNSLCGYKNGVYGVSLREDGFYEICDSKYILGQYIYEKEVAQKYADELNEIIGGK
ncbi:MAG: hypothetical protein ACRCXT_21365 [Paraclostridium sp.]